MLKIRCHKLNNTLRPHPSRKWVIFERSTFYEGLCLTEVQSKYPQGRGGATFFLKKTFFGQFFVIFFFFQNIDFYRFKKKKKTEIF